MENKKITCLLVLMIVSSLTACGSAKVEQDARTEAYVVEEVVSQVKETAIEVEEQVTEDIVIEEIKDEKVATVESTVVLNSMDGKVSEEDFRVIINGVEVKFGIDINTITDKLGEPDSFSSAKSCLDDGEEKIFTYGGYTVNTYPDKEKDIVYLIELYEDAVTDANIGLGSLKTDVEKAYGTEYEVMGDNIIYEISMEQAITIQYEDDKVVWLDMYYK